MENPTTTNTGTDFDNFFKISFDAIGLDHLKQISVWARITSICAFVGYIFILTEAVFGHPKTLGSDSENTVAVGVTLRASSILGTIIIVIVGGAINYFLYRFAVVVGQGAQNMDALKVNSGFDSLRVYFKIISVLLIIGLSLVLLALLFSR